MDNGHGDQLGKFGFGLATAHKKLKSMATSKTSRTNYIQVSIQSVINVFIFMWASPAPNQMNMAQSKGKNSE